MDITRKVLPIAAALGLPVCSSAAPLPAAYLEARPPVAGALSADTSCRQATADGENPLDYCTNEPEFHGFTLSNRGSARINPAGGAVRRDYIFAAPQNARQEIGLLVYEWGSPDPGGDDSAWSMLSEFIFLPRSVVPSVRLLPDGSAYEVTLPTEEKVLFDARTKEIVAGVLSETAPLDMSKDRFSRRFAGLRYDGRGIMIRSDQRGDTPRSAVVWGQKKTAGIFWRGRVCRVSPAEIWSQDGMSRCLYADDASFYEMIGRKCGWSIGAGPF